MQENLKALTVILILATVIFKVVNSPAQVILAVPGTFERRRNLWFGITLAAFLSHNYWVFMLLSSVFLYRTASKDNSPVGMALFVLLAMPLLVRAVPGFAGIGYLFKLDYFLLISFSVFTPLLIREIRQHSFQFFFGEKTDFFLYAYLILLLLRAFVGSNVYDISGLLRGFFVFFIGIFIPYAVASRTIRETSTLRGAIGSYVIGALVMAAVGIVEASKSWILYSSVPKMLDAYGMGGYLWRGNSLRAIATSGQAIAYGYTMAVGFILMLGLRRHFAQKSLWWAGLALLFFGMISSYSRGPWLGAAAGFLVYVLTGSQRWKNMSRIFITILGGGMILIASPLGEKLYSSTISVDEGSYSYRVMVFDASKRVILRNPIFGGPDGADLAELEVLRQGEGIVDIVNTYIGITLSSGFVGLFLFIGIFGTAIWGILKRMRVSTEINSETMDLGRALLAALVCILVSIYTVSSILFIPVIYYLIVALSVAYARSVASSGTMLSITEGVNPSSSGRLKPQNSPDRSRFRTW
jgi:O-antigen ligase